MTAIPLAFRGPTDGDVSFVFSAWLRSQRGAPGLGAQVSSIYYPRMHSVVEQLWYDPKVAWVVACDPEHTDFVHGYLCGQRAFMTNGRDVPVIHHMYVRKVSRRFGVGTRLVHAFDTRPEGATGATHISTFSPQAREILRTKPGRFVFDPWLLWEHVAPARRHAVSKAVKAQRAEARALSKTSDDFGLGWRDPAPAVSTPSDEEDFAMEFEKMAREARVRGGSVR